MTYSTSYLFCFNKIVGAEGGYTNASNDPGNWTGGTVGLGTLKGTKYGISASSYPTLDILNLTLDQAQDIYFSDYWTPIQGNSLPEGLALVLFDAAVNQGVGTAVKFIQSAVGTSVDGNLGNGTLTSIKSFVLTYTVQYLIALFLRNRLFSYLQDSGWKIEGQGWSERLFSMAITAGQF